MFCCTSRSSAILSYSPSQCQKKDLQNILGCISCADSDLMSPVGLIYTSREFQPRRLRLLLHNSPPCSLKLPLVQHASFAGPFLPPLPPPNSDWQQTKHMDTPFCAQQSRQEHHPPLTFPFSCGVSRHCLYPTYQLPCCCCSRDSVPLSLSFKSSPAGAPDPRDQAHLSQPQ